MIIVRVNFQENPKNMYGYYCLRVKVLYITKQMSSLRIRLSITFVLGKICSSLQP